MHILNAFFTTVCRAFRADVLSCQPGSNQTLCLAQKFICKMFSYKCGAVKAIEPCEM